MGAKVPNPTPCKSRSRAAKEVFAYLDKEVKVTGRRPSGQGGVTNEELMAACTIGSPTTASKWRNAWLDAQRQHNQDDDQGDEGAGPEDFLAAFPPGAMPRTAKATKAKGMTPAQEVRKAMAPPPRVMFRMPDFLGGAEMHAPSCRCRNCA